MPLSDPQSGSIARFIEFAALPELGVGLGFRGPLNAQVRAAAQHIDWLELLSEEWMPLSWRRAGLIHDLRQTWPMAIHGTELSVGSTQAPSATYLDQVRTLAEVTAAPWFSDHVCFTREGEIAMGHLTPLPRSLDMARRVGRQAAAIQDAVGIPLLLENISYHFVVQGDISEEDFYSVVLAEAGCGMLLDITNTYSNAVNFGFDPFEQLGGFPLERVVEVHVAGGRWVDGFLEDSHDAPVMSEVWDLLRFVVEHAEPKAVLLERDASFPDDFAEITDDLDRMRGILADSRADGRRA